MKFIIKTKNIAVLLLVTFCVATLVATPVSAAEWHQVSYSSGYTIGGYTGGKSIMVKGSGTTLYKTLTYSSSRQTLINRVNACNTAWGCGLSSTTISNLINKQMYSSRLVYKAEGSKIVTAWLQQT